MTTYGFVLGAIPVGILNFFIVVVDVYYLAKIYSTKETFEILEVRADNKYLTRFLDFHKKEILKFFPKFEYKSEMNTVSFFVLRNMAVAGIFLAHKQDEHTLFVGLDYVIPAYRDFKNGRYIYLRLKKDFINQGITKIVTHGDSSTYIQYLEKLGFHKNQEGMYEKSIV